jgi:hypothetical protein
MAEAACTAMIKIASNEGQIFEVPRDVIRLSNTVNNLLQVSICWIGLKSDAQEPYHRFAHTIGNDGSFIIGVDTKSPASPIQGILIRNYGHCAGIWII